jgi:hypothetical protein
VEFELCDPGRWFAVQILSPTFRFYSLLCAAVSRFSNTFINWTWPKSQNDSRHWLPKQFDIQLRLTKKITQARALTLARSWSRAWALTKPEPCVELEPKYFLYSWKLNCTMIFQFERNWTISHHSVRLSSLATFWDIIHGKRVVIQKDVWKSWGRLPIKPLKALLWISGVPTQVKIHSNANAPISQNCF